jgi:hypothetical protein
LAKDVLEHLLLPAILHVKGQGWGPLRRQEAHGGRVDGQLRQAIRPYSSFVAVRLKSAEQTMSWTRLSLFYLCTYLLIGGLGLLLFPTLALALLLSNGHYDDVMTRVAGMVLAGLGLVIYGIIKTRSEALYPFTLQVRAFFVACIAAFYAMTRDPLFLVLLGIVGLGMMLTGLAYLSERGRMPGQA